MSVNIIANFLFFCQGMFFDIVRYRNDCCIVTNTVVNAIRCCAEAENVSAPLLFGLDSYTDGIDYCGGTLEE